MNALCIILLYVDQGSIKVLVYFDKVPAFHNLLMAELVVQPPFGLFLRKLDIPVMRAAFDVECHFGVLLVKHLHGVLHYEDIYLLEHICFDREHAIDSC